MTTTLPEPGVVPEHRASPSRGPNPAVVRSGQLLVVSTALAAITGFAYWVLAARLYPAADVGRNLAAISALKLIGGIAQLNVAAALLRFVPYSGAASRRVVLRGYLLASAATGAVATVFVLGLGTWTADLRFLSAHTALAVWFVASVTIWSLFSIQDQVLTAVRRTAIVPVENLVFALVELGLLAAFAVALPATGILLSWTVTAALAVVAVSGYLFVRALPRHMTERPVAAPPSMRTIGGFLALDYLASLFLFVAISGLPLLVLDRLGSVATAGFLLAWMLTYSLYLVPLSMGQSLVAHSADPGAELGRDLRTLLGQSGALVLPAAVLLVAFTPQALALFGPDYAPFRTTLRLLALSAVPNVLIDLSVAAAQVRRRMRVVVGVRAAQGLGVVVLALYLMPRHGATGVAAAWLIAQTAVAIALAVAGVVSGRRFASVPNPVVPRPPAPATVVAAPVAVTAVICCYTEQRWDQLVAAVSSLRAQSVRPHQVIVVVDHNPALLVRVLDELPSVTAVPSTGKQGLSGARNTGVALAGTEVVAFLDDDAIALPTWLADQAAAYRDPTVVGTAATIEPLWSGGRPTWFPREFDWVVGCSYIGLPTGPADVRNAIGAGMSLRREAVLAAGGFDEGLGRVGTVPVGCEETELCIRLRAIDPGVRVVTVPTARTWHLVPAERRTFRYFRTRCWAEGTSKAGVRARAGGDSLGTERAYVTRVLPLGFLRAMRERRPRKAFALLAGLALTAAGYVSARVFARPAVRVGAALMPLAAVTGLWLMSLRNVEPAAMTDLGLVSVLPAAWFVALGAVVILLGLHIARGSRGAIIGAHLTGVVAILHATPALLYPEPRYSWTFKHLGVVDYISRHGSLDPGDPLLGVYHSWPGFFTLSSFLSDSAGIDPAVLARWAPVFFQLAFLIPALVAFRALTDDPRRAWLGVSVFALADWVGQDYFAPQALTFLLFLTAVALVLRWGPTDHRGTSALLMVVMFAVASSHQLTPFALVGVLVVLAIRPGPAPRWFPLAMMAFSAAWMGTFGREYLRTHSVGLLATLGRPDSNAAESLASAAVPDQQYVIWAGRALVLAVAALAAWGFLGERRAVRSWTLVLLALAPAPLVVSSYDGEVVFRVYLFALPWLAMLAAGTVYRPSRQARGALAPVALLLAMTVPFTLAYYGKERANYFGSDERAANAWVLDHAEPGSVLMGAALDFPWKDHGYERFTYDWLSQLPVEQRKALSIDPAGVVIDAMGRSGALTGYLLLSDAQNHALAYGSDLPIGIQDSVAAALVRSPVFTVVYTNPAATIFRLDFSTLDPSTLAAIPEVTP